MARLNCPRFVLQPWMIAISSNLPISIIKGYLLIFNCAKMVSINLSSFWVFPIFSISRAKIVQITKIYSVYYF